MSTRVHVLTHVPFEGLGAMAGTFSAPQFRLSYTQLYDSKPLPEIDEFDWLIIMGGPMSVHDSAIYPWLVQEKKLISSAIATGKTVLGICLGAQLIAEALGARVFQGSHREIGWHPVSTHLPGQSQWSGVFPKTFDAFHWHGETFDIPDGAVPLASTVACRNQGFIFGDRVVALQFHLETTPESASALIAHCGNELDGSLFVQDPAVMLADKTRFVELNTHMIAVLHHLESIQ